MRQSRRQLYEINIWPGFVDILGTILIVTIFTVLISTITQIYFNDQLEIKRGEISSLDNKISSLSSKDREKGIIAASAGNHAQGVAAAAQLLGGKSMKVLKE